MKANNITLSRRERQIMDIVYRLGQATAAEVLDGLPDAPSYSAVRALLRILEDKGQLRHEKKGPRYVYFPTTPHTHARQNALEHVVSTFFRGSVTQAMAALLDLNEDELQPEDLDRMQEMIAQAKAEGR